MVHFVTQALPPPLADTSIDPLHSLTNAVSIVHENSHHKALMASIKNTNDLVTFSEAIKDSKWCKAMDSELRALEENQTWEVTILPLGKEL